MDWEGGSDCDSDTEAGIDWVDDADFEATSDVLQSSELQPMVTASDHFWGTLSDGLLRLEMYGSMWSMQPTRYTQDVALVFKQSP